MVLPAILTIKLAIFCIIAIIDIAGTMENASSSGLTGKK